MKLSTITGWIMTILTAVFVMLKLSGAVSWSWWWVVSPVWISIVYAVVVMAIGFLVLIFAAGD